MNQTDLFSFVEFCATGCIAIYLMQPVFRNRDPSFLAYKAIEAIFGLLNMGVLD